MSCSLERTCHIPDITNIQKYLFGDDQNGLNQVHVDDDSWDEEKWVNSWGDEDNETEVNRVMPVVPKLLTLQTSNNVQTQMIMPMEHDFNNGNEEMDSSEIVSQGWLRKCHIAFSPTYDLMALAHGNKLILLAAKSDSSAHRQKSRMNFNVTAKVEVSTENSEHITSLLCVPLVSLKRTSHGSTDWSCVIVGFSSGHVRFYTETAALLVSQLFHESPVVEVKCKTHDSVGPRKHRCTFTEQNDEITVLYSDALVVLDGFSLFQTLRACRSQVALAAASGGMAIDPPPLSYKKWTLTGGQSNVSSHVSSGILTENPFDQMRTASVRGGFSAEVRGAPPAMLCYVAMGSAPFTGFYFAVEGSSQPLLSHVALAVASKLKSALYNSASRWLSWGGQQEVQTQPKPKVELGTPLDIRSGLSDQLRRGHNVILSPDASLSSCALAATTDSLGRVLIVDLTRAIALRIWKGYRDAQIGFVRVFDDAHRSTHHHRNNPSKISDITSKPDSGICRHAVFLLIYAPRRGLLEVWTCVNGPRVGAFNVSKNARLLYPGYGMMGMNNSTMSGSHSHMFQCCLVDENGSVQEVTVPFHLALSDSNSKKARDMHLLKKLNILLHSKKKAGEEAVKLLLEIRISTMQRQALDRLLHTKRLGVEIFRSCITAIQQRLQEGGSTSLKKEDQDLLAFCDTRMKLINLFEAITKLNEGGYATIDNATYDLEDASKVDQLSKLLHMTRSEAEEALKSLNTYQESCQKPRVRFESGDKKSTSLDIAEFLDCFTHESKMKEEDSSLKKSRIHFHLSDQGKVSKLANFLFHASLFGSTSPDDIIFSLEGALDVNVQTILSLLLTHWLLQDDAITKNLANATEKLYMYVEAYSRSYHNEQREGNETFHLWEWIREEMCAPSRNVIAAYFLSLICRGIIISSQTQVKDNTDEGEMEEGEEASNLGKNDWERMQNNDEEAPPSYEDSCTGENAKHQEGGEWETLWIETEEWNLFVRQLEDSLLINTAINLGMEKSPTVRSPVDGNKPSSVLKGAEKSSSSKNVVNNQDESAFEKVGVRDLLMNGSGIIAELVSHSIRKQRIPPNCLKLPMNIEGIGSDVNPQQKQFLDFLHLTLYPRFPYSLVPDCLHAHCFWDMMVCWNKDPLVISNMFAAIEHLRLVRHDPHVRHGLAVMAWKTFVSKRFVALAKLIEKVGKAPKDRLCRKDVGISDTDMADFCQACTEILQTIADADLDMVPKSEDGLTEKQSQAIEDAWQGVTGRRSIMDLARSHTNAHYGIVQHHMHLSFILQATMQFSIRGVKPLSLFDHRGKSCFEMDLTVQDPDLPNMDNIDVLISKARQKFLSKVVSAAVGKLAVLLKNADYLSGSGKKDELQKDDLEKWIETAVHMASEFQINVEQVNIHHVQELFSHGLDALGNEACNSVSDKDVLASCLVSIVGQRLSYLLLQASPDDGVVMLSQMPPTLSTWIKSQDCSLLENPKVTGESTLALVRKILSMMSEQHSQYNLTLFLEEAASAITSS